MIDEFDPKTEWVRVQEVSLMGARYVQEGKAAQVVVNGVRICLVRKGDQLYALRDRCPHAGAPLHQGQLDEHGHLVCPWHRFKFCVEDGKSAAGEGFAVQAFPVQIEEDGTYVGFPKPEPKKWWEIF
jgi:nitrite reductase/ring-hydroxylating ferredoxin subunit